MLKLKFACSVITGLALFAGVELALAAEKPSSEQIINALTPKKPLTRSLSISPAEAARSAEDKRFIDSAAESDDALAFVRRAPKNRDHRQGSAEHRSRNQVQLQLGRHRACGDV